MTKTKTLPPPFDNPAYTVALIGYGSLAKKTAAGLRRAGFKGRILVTGRDQEKLRRNADLYNVECVSNEEAANQADLVIVSTKANVLLNMVSSIRQCFLERPHVPIISFAAALRVDDIRRALEQDGNGTPVIRAMPTTLVATASESPIAIYIPPDDAQKCEPLIKAFFQMLGTPIFLDEEKKIPSAVAVACSPAFTWKIMLSMEQALLEEGWKETDARIAIATMMKSAADLVLENPEIDLNNAICAVATKGGFTERELKRMEKLKVFTAFKEAYAAVTEGCETLSDELSLDVEASKYRATLLGKTSP